MNPEPVLNQNRDLMEQLNQMLLAENTKEDARGNLARRA
jgi:hypothetical protein